MNLYKMFSHAPDNSYRTAIADKNTIKFRYKFDSSYKLGQNTVDE